MKKFSFLLISLCTVTGIALSVFAENNKPKACDLLLTSIECLTQGEAGKGDDNPPCRWKVIDCPGLFTGDYEACIVNGDGYGCACGSVSRDCNYKQ